MIKRAIVDEFDPEVHKPLILANAGDEARRAPYVSRRLMSGHENAGDVA